MKNLELFTKAEVVDLIKEFRHKHGNRKIPAFPGLAEWYLIEYDATDYLYYGTRVCRIDSIGGVFIYE